MSRRARRGRSHGGGPATRADSAERRRGPEPGERRGPTEPGGRSAGGTGARPDAPGELGVDGRHPHERPGSDGAPSIMPAPAGETRPAVAIVESRAPGSEPHPDDVRPTVPADSGSTPGTGPAEVHHGADLAGAERRPSCTVAQLRRFIKSRPWVPMHELRRRFGIVGADDDVSPVRVGAVPLFVGLPDPEAGVLEELLRGGDVGYELALDPGCPIIVGVYPMRPVPRG